MATVSYITPITNRTRADVEYARSHQNDLVNKNIGAWNYTDLNRICNNLKYASEYMYEQGFLSQPYSMQIKLNWTETDIITYEQLNTMIVANMNNLKTYSRPDIKWNHIASIANMNYNIANWLEENIHALATQEPIPPDTYTLTVNNGTGSGEYEARTEVLVQANNPGVGQIFSHWSGEHLENIIEGSGTSSVITYKMPLQNITLTANYTTTVPHTLTIITYSGTETVDLLMGDVQYIEADPAPQGKVFHHWEVEPLSYKDNLYEPAATTHFTMPNEAVILTAVYITKGEKQLVVNNGKGSGWYEYDEYVSVSSNKPENGIFDRWYGDTQYLTGDVTSEYNSVRIPDVNRITITANWTVPYTPTPPVTNVQLTVVNGIISSTGETTGLFTQGDRVTVVADPVPQGKAFSGWSKQGGGTATAVGTTATVVIGTTATTITATYRTLEYHTLTVTTNSGTTVSTKEQQESFTVDARPIPDGYVFDKWTGDTSGLVVSNVSGSTTMGISDRTITANYRLISPHTVTVKQLSGDVTYTQAELSTVSLTAETAPAGTVFTGWTLTGYGRLSNYSTANTIYTFGGGDGVLTPRYVNVWTITVINGTIDNGQTTATLMEGTRHNLSCRSMASYEGFNSWTLSGSGTIYNTAAASTYFYVGNGDAIITANIIQYPDKTLTIYATDPDTETTTLISSTTYTYGSKIEIEAPVASDKTTFLSWIGGDQDIAMLSPSALASSVTINSLTRDTTITATYFYPEAPEYYTLTVYNGYPQSGTYAAGSQVAIRANTPSQGYEFYKWYGDTAYLVNPDLTLDENAVIMPIESITLYAKYTLVGELPLFRVSVTNGTASGQYITGEGTEQETVHNVSGVYIDIPAGTEVTLTANPDVVGYVFDYWDGNFTAAGVIDIDTTRSVTTFTMVESDINATMVRRELNKYTVYTTNATGPGTAYQGGPYAIAGSLSNTENVHYTFNNWTCVDANDTDYISAIGNPNLVETTITLTDRDLWIEAHYTAHYKLTVVNGQNTDQNEHYYYDGETISTVYANTAPTGYIFDHWDDPVGIISNIYDPTPEIEMKDSVATITAIYTSLDQRGNSIVVTGIDLHTGIIKRSRSTLINGIFTTGAIVFDRDGCIGVITEVDPDQNDNTDDYRVTKLFYGGNS